MDDYCVKAHFFSGRVPKNVHSLRKNALFLVLASRYIYLWTNSKIFFEELAFEQYLNWQMQDKKTLKRINILIKDIQRDAYVGIGKPEQLKGDLSGFWSRRIDDKHRLIYCVEEEIIKIIQCGRHYNDK